MSIVVFISLGNVGMLLATNDGNHMSVDCRSVNRGIFLGANPAFGDTGLQAGDGPVLKW